MVIQCPQCRFSLTIKERPPGRYATRCPSCESRFAVTFHNDPNLSPQVAALPGESPRPIQTPAPSRPDPEDTEVEPTAAPAPVRMVDGLPTLPGPDDGLDTSATEIQVAESLNAARKRSQESSPGYYGLAARPEFDLSLRQPETPVESPPVASGAPSTIASLPPPIDDDPVPTPRILGRFLVLRRLNPGGLGPVYQARDLTTGELVVLKTLRPRWASLPGFVAGLTRDALAATVIRHPNATPILYVGTARGTWFAVCESPDGPGEPVASDPELAAARVLHASRAIRKAHEEGLVHRDLRPESLQTSASGVLLVDDFGLGRRPALNTPGTPIPISDPEDGDPDLDRARLGLILAKWLREGSKTSQVPAGLAEISARWNAPGGSSEARFRESIAALEQYLGVPAGPFTPTDAQARALEEAASEFQNVPLVRIRDLSALGLSAAFAALVGVALLLGRPIGAIGIVGVGLIAATAVLVVRHLREPSGLLRKLRELATGGGRQEWAITASSVLLILAGLWALHFLMFAIFLTLLAVGGAFAFRQGVDVPIDEARRGPLSRILAMLDGLRRRGVAEVDIRRFVCRGAGTHWEELYETLFGYEAKREARTLWGVGVDGRRRPRFAGWRDPLHDLLDAQLGRRRDLRLRALLQRTEEARLVAEGTNLLTARRRSARIADATIEVLRARRGSLLPPEQAFLQALRKASQTPDSVLQSATSDHRPDALKLRESLGRIFGPSFRFLLGALFLAGCFAWMIQNDIVSGRDVQDSVRHAVESGDHNQALDDAKKVGTQTLENLQRVVDHDQPTEPLRLPMLPTSIGEMFDGFGPGLAGLLLIGSSFFAGGRLTLFALPGALVAFFGPRLGLPAIGPISAAFTGGAIGLAALVVGVLFGRR